jgi:hypothetical protein
VNKRTAHHYEEDLNGDDDKVLTAEEIAKLYEETPDDN